MAIIMVTGSAGLIGSESVRFFSQLGDIVVGIDNDMRSQFFGDDASTRWNRDQLVRNYPNYLHYDVDIRDSAEMIPLFQKYGTDLSLIIHTAAQPSHDWAAKDPFTDFTINANGTLLLLECMRQYCPQAVFIFTSTNKVYGDRPNELPLIELETRWEIDPSHPYANGIDETMSIDDTKHSLFGVSKVAADVLVQEYGRYFGLKTGCFRGGCLTGPNHSGAELHGFLSYLVKCTLTDTPYTVLGYKGKQVRDNIHSSDFVRALFHFYQNPGVGEVYNIGGGRFSNCSMLEAIAMCEHIVGKSLSWKYDDTNRIGDHIWWISNMNKFRQYYPNWQLQYNVHDIIEQIVSTNAERWG
jgi:CDP-paratose 2-epimerase